MKLSQITELKQKIENAKAQKNIIEGKISVHLRKLKDLGFKDETSAKRGLKKLKQKIEKGESKYSKLLHRFLKKYQIEETL